MKGLEMDNRQAECMRADKAIARAISNIERQGRHPDGWEGGLIKSAIGARYRGIYRAAESYAKNAMTPTSDRSSQASLSSSACNIAILKNAFRVARAEPIRPYPHFGPIVFIGGEQEREGKSRAG